MTTLKFDARKVCKLATRTIMARRFCKNFEGKEPRALVLVKDEGIYLMSNMEYPKGKTPSSEGEVIYAEGFGPDADWDDVREAVGGDDFAEYIDATDIGRMATGFMVNEHGGVMPAYSKLVIKMTESKMEVYFK